MKLKKLLCVFVILVICIGAFLAVFFKNTNQLPELKNSSNLSNTSTASHTSMVSNTSTTSNASAISNSSRTSNASNTSNLNSSWINDVINAIQSQASNLNPNVLKLSLIAYQNAEKKGITKNPLLTIVDYSKPSTDRRLWVIDLNQKKVLVNTWVAHGKNSGNVNASSFSNRPQSLESSIGVFVTQEIYSGKHGNSLRVQGLESGFNDNAYKRSIVFHGANYVSASIAKAGRLGRSWGCWAVSQDVIGSLVNMIKNKVLVVAYYPDKNWLGKSVFLK